MTAQERYQQANTRHMAAAAAIGAYRTSHGGRIPVALKSEFDATHEERRLAFLALVPELRRG
jgi:hypothetical protein